MNTPYQIALVALTALAAAVSHNYPPMVTITLNLDPMQVPVGFICNFTSDLQASKAPTLISQDSATITPTGSYSPSVTDGTEIYMTISITNQYRSHVSVSLASDAGGPSPIGSPTPAILPNASPTQYIFPTGWAGRVCIGPNLNPNGSKIEGSFTGPPDIDVSYVDGYSVPITCSSEGVAVSGCNIDLFRQTYIPCDNQVPGPVCINPAKDTPDGPASRFFATCAGAAYTYPNDNDANASNLGSNLVTCCVGTSCKAPFRQAKKRTRETD